MDKFRGNHLRQEWVNAVKVTDIFLTSESQLLSNNNWHHPHGRVVVVIII